MLLSYADCSIRAHRSFTTIFQKCLILLLVYILHFPIMLALCLLLSMIHYAQNYAGIIGECLQTGVHSYINKQLQHSTRVDIMWDTYIPYSERVYKKKSGKGVQRGVKLNSQITGLISPIMKGNFSPF